MKFLIHNARAAQLEKTRADGFTMMEIAIALAVIGVALVAIIGVLPIGMNVQQSNRQETVIGQDATVYMNAVRNGALGYDDLTNYVYAITNSWVEFNGSGQPSGAQGVDGYTYSYAPVASVNPALGEPLTNGANIVGLLSMPEYITARSRLGLGGLPIPNIMFGGISNHIVAYCHSISGPAIEKPPQDNPILHQDSFSYRIYCENAPPPVNTNAYVNGVPSLFDSEKFGSLHELRMTFEWPQLANGNLGPGRETFRTLVAGQSLHQPPYNPSNPNVIWDTNLFCYRPQWFTNTP
ncbi:MAG: type IV pilus modification PilV family protein [Limisphaerales bacterium]